ncbi:MAG: putative lipid II flippase FtsW [Bdellovibrionia bacterium]
MDWKLFFLVLAMVVFGLIMVYSSSFILAQERSGNGFALIRKQLLFAILGFLAMAGAIQMDYGLWRKHAPSVLAGAVFLLFLVLLPGVGHKVGGAQRWLKLGPVRFQPAELAKFAMIFFGARFLESPLSWSRFSDPKRIGEALLFLPAFFLLLIQPDFGTTVIIALVLFFMVFVSGVRPRALFAVFFPIAVGALLVAFGSEYRRARIRTFWDPWQDPAGKGFQILQSFVGLHNGGLFGVGLGNSREKLFYLPEAHNDFIFSVIGEELGFLGVFTVVFAYLYLMFKGLNIAWNCQRKKQDRFGMLLATGITLALSFQGFVNAAVVFGLLPTKGLALPFLSYGGSALVVDLFAVGVLLSIARSTEG